MTSDHDPRDDGWAESTEGDLDPDLAEESPYSAWEPSGRSSMLPKVVKVISLAVLLALVASVVLPALR